MDRRFEELGRRYLDESPALSPVSATLLGDHRFDAELDDVSAASRARKAAFYREFLQELDAIDPSALSRAHQVDHALLKHHLRAGLCHPHQRRADGGKGLHDDALRRTGWGCDIQMCHGKLLSSGSILSPSPVKMMRVLGQYN